MNPAPGPLLRPGDKLRREAALLRRLLNQGPVIARDAQAGGQLLADHPPSAAELTADGNHIVAHTRHLLSKWTILETAPERGLRVYFY